ncbi:MAG: hypothetical protein OXP12_00850 [Thaumarchaeota archaeon]|nr:hypothetical protein [Nitrososphaerota archaeon]
MYGRNGSSDNRGTVHMTIRVPRYVADALEHEAARLNVSTGHLHNSILRKWADWDVSAQSLGLVPTPREVLADTMSGMSESEIRKTVSKSMEFVKDAVIMMEGSYDLKRCVATLEKYMRATGMASDHTVENGVHCFTVRHKMGIPWSPFVASLLRQLFAEFVPDKEASFEMSDGTAVVRVDLGSGWDEHDY